MATQKRKTNSKKRPSSNKKTNHKNTKKEVQEQSLPPFFKKEFILLITLGISLFLLLANFGIGSEWIKNTGLAMRGFFGILNYLFPILLFLGVSFILANPGNARATLKVVAFVLLFVSLAILFALILPWDDGVLGGFFGNLLAEAIGMPLTIILILLLIIFNLVIITEKSFFQAVGDGSRKMYDMAQSDAAKRKEQHEERRDVRIAEARKVREENGKAYGVPMDIRLDENVQTKHNLHEVKVSAPEIIMAQEQETGSIMEHSFAQKETDDIVPEIKANTSKRRKRKAEKDIVSDTYFQQEIEFNDVATMEKTEEKNEVSVSKPEGGKRISKSSKYQYPPVSLLRKGTSVNNVSSNKALTDLARRLEQTLLSFGVKVTVNNVTCGPSVTRFELLPEVGTKVSKITSLEDDIKMNLAAATIRIEAPIPGKAAIGIEIPNEKTSPVLLRDLIESYELKNHPSKIAFAAGKDISGKVIVGDIAKFPHMLVAGTTGSGKSVYTNSIIMSILYRATPEEVRLIVIDPKVVEFQVYDGIPHLLIPVVTDPKKAAGALNWAVGEMNNRYNLFAEQRVRDLKDYNEKISQMKVPEGTEPPKPLPQIVIIIDELADLMMVAKNDVETSIVRIAQLARAAGIYMIIATQRPSVDVVTGLIKANMPSRTSLRVSTGTDSRVVIDQVGAEKLLGNGDMLFYPAGFKYPERVQGAYVSTEEIEKTVEFLKSRNQEVEYNQAIEESMNAAANSGGSDMSVAGVSDDLDSLFESAGKYIIDKNKASIGNLQRVFKIGFNRAARIMDQLCDAGVVGEEQGTKPREVLMSMEEFEQYIEDYV